MKKLVLILIASIVGNSFINAQQTAIRLYGGDDYAQIRINSPSTIFDEESFTFETIVSADNTSSLMTILYNQISEVDFGITSSRELYFEHGGHLYIAKHHYVEPEVCTHIAVSVKDEYIYFYIDGDLVHSEPLQAPVNFPNQTDFLLGGKGSSVDMFHGLIDEVRIWSRARSHAEILQFAFTTADDSQWPMYLLLTFWEGAGTFTQDMMPASQNYAQWGDGTTISWEDPCLDPAIGPLLACVPDPAQPNNLICNGKFEQYHPVLDNRPDFPPYSETCMEINAMGYTQVVNWFPKSQGSNTPDFFVRNGLGGVPLTLPWLPGTNPNTWDWPATGNNAMMGMVASGWGPGNMYTWHEGIRTELLQPLIPGNTYVFSGWFYTRIEDSTSSFNGPDLRIYFESQSDPNATSISWTHPLTENSMISFNDGWEYVSIIFTLPAGSSASLDELVLTFDDDASISSRYSLYTFMDDLVLVEAPTCSDCFQEYFNTGYQNNLWDRRIKVDAYNNIYVMGKVSDQNQPHPPLEFGLPPATTVPWAGSGIMSSFIAKYSSTGALLWAERYEYMEFNDFEIMPNGNLFVVGTTEVIEVGSSPPTFPYSRQQTFSSSYPTDCGTPTPLISDYNTPQLLIATINSSGSVIYANSYGGSGSEKGVDVEIIGNKAYIACEIMPHTLIFSLSPGSCITDPPLNDGLNWSSGNLTTSKILEFDLNSSSPSGYFSNYVPTGLLQMLNSQGTDLYVLTQEEVAKISTSNLSASPSASSSIPSSTSGFIWSKGIYVSDIGEVYLTYKDADMEKRDNNLSVVATASPRELVVGNGSDIYAIGYEDPNTFFIEKLNTDPLMPFGSTVWRNAINSSSVQFINYNGGIRSSSLVPFNNANKVAFVNTFSPFSQNWSIPFDQNIVAGTNGPNGNHSIVATIEDNVFGGIFKMDVDEQPLAQELENTIIIFPNPTSKEFSIKSDMEISHVKVLSFEGKVLSKIDNIDSKEVLIPFERMSSGVYFVEIICGELRYVEKLIVQ